MSAFRDYMLGTLPKLYWRLGEASGTSAADESGNGWAGTYTNSPTLAATGLVSGDSDTAVTFDGVNDYVSLGYDASFGSSGAAFSVCCLMKSTGSTGRLVSRDLDASHKDWSIHLATGAATFSSNAMGTDVTGPTVNDGNTHLVVGTYDGSKMRLYTDGALQGTSASVGRSSTSMTNTGIYLASRGGATSFLAVTLDEVAVFTYALSAAQVADLWDLATTGAITRQIPTIRRHNNIRAAALAAAVR